MERYIPEEEQKHLQVKSKFVPSLLQNLQRRTYVAFMMPDGVMSARISHTLSFVVQKVDCSDGENNNIKEKVEYKLKELEFSVTYYIEKMSKDFREEWGNIGQNRERVYKFEYQPFQPYNSLSDVFNLLGIHPCEGTEVVPEDATLHTCLLAGKYLEMD
ncbi:coatomer subunit gamma-1-like [Apium graveolens]|uniref:coatomer subunit gamma-1-like n=1 Tax=Apium graveolens TaxID=4045 RepID=UPI003D7A2FA5